MTAVRFAKGERVDYRVPGGGWRPGVVTADLPWGGSTVAVAPLVVDRSNVLSIQVTDGTLRTPKAVAAAPWRYDARNHVHPRLRPLAPVFLEGPPAPDWPDEDEDEDEDAAA